MNHTQDFINNIYGDIYIADDNNLYMILSLIKRIIITDIPMCYKLFSDIKNNFITHKQNSILKTIRLDIKYNDIILQLLLDTLMETHNPIKLYIYSPFSMDICNIICKLINNNKLAGLYICQSISESVGNLLSNTLTNNTSLKKLHIYDRIYKFDFLKYNNTIKKIACDTPKKLYNVLKHNNRIDNINLNIRVNNICDVTKILHNKNIKKMAISVPYTIKNIDIIPVMKAISNNVTLQKLIIGFNDIFQKTYTKYLVNFITHNTMLKQLSIQSNQFDIYDIKQIVSAINKNISLEFIEILYIINLEQMRLIYKSLKKNRTLKYISIHIFPNLQIFKIMIKLINSIQSLYTMKYRDILSRNMLNYYNLYGAQMLKFNPRIIIDAPKLSGPILDLCNRNKHNCYQKNVTLFDLLYI